MHSGRLLNQAPVFSSSLSPIWLDAADYCNVPELRRASREQVEAFVKHLAEYASNDRDGLICQLNGYAQPKENHEEKAAGAA